ncbi:hypothetical protein P0R27_38165 [Bradyrhizobium yuanmingense]|nr:hypothetical protein [Bradyrhizobium yuanmingense]
MDNYPKRLKPKVDASGWDKEPFEAWWKRAQRQFKTVPENVAQYWLHEHWGNSPYSYLRSANYQFELVTWKAEELFEILSTWNRFNPDHRDCVNHGHRLVDDWEFNEPYRTSAYMLEHGDFPAPIIVLDNRDGHINPEAVEFANQVVPEGYVLMEGHRRFNIALYLHSTKRLKPEVRLWLMTKIPA